MCDKKFHKKNFSNISVFSTVQSWSISTNSLKIFSSMNSEIHSLSLPNFLTYSIILKASVGRRPYLKTRLTKNCLTIWLSFWAKDSMVIINMIAIMYTLQQTYRETTIEIFFIYIAYWFSMWYHFLWVL